MKRCRRHITVGATCIPPPLFNINPYASRQFINLTDIPVECIWDTETPLGAAVSCHLKTKGNYRVPVLIQRLPLMCILTC